MLSRMRGIALVYAVKVFFVLIVIRRITVPCSHLLLIPHLGGTFAELPPPLLSRGGR
jgi:hypothetical protein